MVGAAGFALLAGLPVPLLALAPAAAATATGPYPPQTFTGYGTYTVPPGVTELDILAVGGSGMPGGLLGGGGTGTAGGPGGTAQGLVPVFQGETFTVYARYGYGYGGGGYGAGNGGFGGAAAVVYAPSGAALIVAGGGGGGGGGRVPGGAGGAGGTEPSGGGTAGQAGAGAGPVAGADGGAGGVPGAGLGCIPGWPGSTGGGGGGGCGYGSGQGGQGSWSGGGGGGGGGGASYVAPGVLDATFATANASEDFSLGTVVITPMPQASPPPTPEPSVSPVPTPSLPTVPLPSVSPTPVPSLPVQIGQAIGFPSQYCAANGGTAVVDNTTEGVTSFLYTYQPSAQQVDVCFRAQDASTGLGGMMVITPSAPGVSGGGLGAPSADGDGSACSTTTPNGVPGSHPMSSGQVDGTTYSADAYSNASAAWVCLQVGFSVDNRVVVPVQVSAPGVSPGVDVTFYPDPGTP